MPKIYGNTEINGDVLINGSFSITGSYSVINSQSLTITDNIIVLAHSQSGPYFDAGIFIDRGSGTTQSLIWNEDNSTWAFVYTDTTHGNLGNINILDYSNVKAGTVSVYRLASKDNPSSRYLDFDSNAQLRLTTDNFTDNYLRLNGDNLGISELKASSVSKLSVLNGFTIISSTSGAGAFFSYNLADYTFLSRIDTNTGTNNFVLNHAGVSSNNQRLSIGTSSGTTNLHIFRTSPGGIRIEDTTQGNGYLLVSDSNGVGTWTASSSLNLVSGSGTINYLPRWTSSSQLSSTSSIYDTGSQVGIGTSNPTSKLHVKGVDTGAATYSLKIDDGSNNPMLYLANDKSLYLYGNVSHTVSDGTIGYYLTITSAYSYGMLLSGAPLYANYAAIGNTSRTHFYSSESQKTAYEADMAATVSSALRIGFNASMPGINTTGTNIAFAADVRNGSTGNYTIYSSNGDSYFNNTTMRLNGRTNGSESVFSLWNLAGINPLLYVQNDTKIGINTNAPSTKLHIYATQSGALRLQDTTQGSGYLLVSDSNGVATWTSSNSLGLITATGTSNYVPKWNSTTGLSSTSSIYIDGSDNVGIGTASPTSLLHLYSNTSDPHLTIQGGTAASSSELRLNGYAQSFIRFYVNSVESANINQVGSVLFYRSPNAGGHVFRNMSNIDLVNILSSGDVGVGTDYATQTARLHVKGATSTSASYALKVDDSLTNPLMYVRNDGNVGIGTASPSTKFHVFATQSGAFRLQDTTESNGYLLVSDANGVATWTSSSGILNSLSGITGSGTTNYIPKWNSQYNLSSTSSVYDNGNVGIGTTNPLAKLNVVGSTTSIPVFKVDGTSGELFSVTDNLTGSLFSVNDISGLPILEVFSDNTIFMGDYQAPAVFTTKKTDISAGTTSIYSFATASYSGAFVDYTATSGSNVRAGSIAAVWSGANIVHNETSTVDIGNTLGLTLSFVISGTYAVFQAVAVTDWELKTIFRSI